MLLDTQPDAEEILVEQVKYLRNAEVAAPTPRSERCGLSRNG